MPGPSTLAPVWFGGDRADDCPSHASHSRRALLAGVAALGLTGIGPIVASIAQISASTMKRGLIDVHHHFVPRFYFVENQARIAAAAGGRVHPGYASWTPEQAIGAMDQQQVATAVLSLTTPGVWFGDAKAAAQTARRVNEYAADLASRHPARFGIFAVIPLPDTERSLREIDYAFTVMKADGIGLMTSYDDKWLGDPAYEAVFEELNRRKAVVFVHPTTGLCCRTLLPDVNPIMLEIPQDTTRAVANLLFSGTFSRFREIRFVFSHAGGNIPMVLGRMHQYSPTDIADKAPNGIECELKRLYYDIAGTAYQRQLLPSRALFQRHRFCSGATTRSSRSRRRRRQSCTLAFPCGNFRASCTRMRCDYCHD